MVDKINQGVKMVDFYIGFITALVIIWIVLVTWILHKMNREE